MTGEITLRGRVLPDRRAEEQDPRRPPVGGEDGDPAAQEREGPARHPRGDPQADQARPRRLDGPGPGGGPAAQAEAARRPSRRRSSRATTSSTRSPRRRAASGGRRSRPPTSRRSWSTSAAEPSGCRRTPQAAPSSRPRRGRIAQAVAMEYQDYYAVLGVPRTASQAEIKKAFRKLAREHHPDASPATPRRSAGSRTSTRPTRCCRDPDKRKQYDALGANWEAFSRAGARGRRRIRSPGSRALAGRAARPARPATSATSSARAATPGSSPTSSACSSGARAGSPTWPAPAPAPAEPAAAAGTIDLEDFLAGMGGGRAIRPRPRGVEPGSARRAAAARGAGRDHARRGLPRDDPPRRRRRQATRGHDPARGGHRHADPPDRQGTGRWRPRRRRPPAPRRDLHPQGRGPRARAADHPEGGPARRRGPGSVAEGHGAPAGSRRGRSPDGTFRLRGQGMPKFRAEGHGDLYVRAKVVLPTDLTDEARDAARALPRRRRPTRSTLIERTQRDRTCNSIASPRRPRRPSSPPSRPPSGCTARSSTPSTCSARSSSPTTASPPRPCAGSASTCPRSAASSPRSSPSVPGSRAARSRSIPAPSASSSAPRPRHGGSATSTPRPSTCCSAWPRPAARPSSCSSGTPPDARRSSRRCRAFVAASA